MTKEAKIYTDKKHTKINENKNKFFQNRICSSKREVYSDTSLSQETRKILNNLRLHLKQLETEQQKALKVNRRKEIIKIRAEIKEMEKKKTVATVKLNTISLRR